LIILGFDGVRAVRVSTGHVTAGRKSNPNLSARRAPVQQHSIESACASIPSRLAQEGCRRRDHRYCQRVGSPISQMRSALLPTIAHSVAGRLVAQVSYGSVPPRSRDEARANPSTAGSAGTSWSTTQQAFEAGVLDELGYP
jgi:hypothetical protein